MHCTVSMHLSHSHAKIWTWNHPNIKETFWPLISDIQWYLRTCVLSCPFCWYFKWKFYCHILFIDMKLEQLTALLNNKLKKRHKVLSVLSQRPQLNPRPIHVGFVMDKVALGQIFLQVLGFPVSVLFQLCLIHICSSIHHQFFDLHNG
jgi:hypothetical protein